MGTITILSRPEVGDTVEIYMADLKLRYRGVKHPLPEWVLLPTTYSALWLFWALASPDSELLNGGLHRSGNFRPDLVVFWQIAE
ncbi:hypothetical protein DC522_03180 [Microvirga sp. KLBC 81]|uniref:hypothetical protein n=1 Tax=Microvirga sp. KLBC 81 TaxID=1862707 RepID=UPI000D522990|nr:hypothetical protein [Microvirga sp. KLBC 81]PVE25790.1 hypothetical protein DC522_03180 [Microvirga sp. KLBC 81]